ncbi:signal peptidase I [Sesbania bispinosa]|nr:signal peptidase I [Sesbania bispinosa]
MNLCAKLFLSLQESVCGAVWCCRVFKSSRVEKHNLQALRERSNQASVQSALADTYC